MAKKYYAVRKGLVPGIYTSWADCQQNINGFSGAIYKGFSNEMEAKSFLADGKISDDEESSISRIYSEAEAVAYVDGSYNNDTKEYSYGAVIFYEGGEKHLSAKFSNMEKAKMRNVAGEIEGAMCAMKFCIDNDIKSMDLFYDYVGIANWCNGAWKANKEGTKEYRKFYNEVSKTVKINFMKVKGHSGDTYNDLADSLAKSALGIG